MSQETKVDKTSYSTENEKEILMKRLGAGIGLNLSDLRNRKNEE